MKLFRNSLFICAVAPLLFSFGSLRADDLPDGPKGSEPRHVNVCIVSGEHLNAGEIVSYVYKEEGKADRTVRFCCRKCLARFKADPGLYLKKLDRLESELPLRGEGDGEPSKE
jgi:hypothetical protein